MAGDAARPRDPRFPNLAPEVVAGYLDAPSTMCAEIIDGALSLMPRPRPRHARAAGKLLTSLDGPFDRGGEGPGGWVLLPEPELHLGAGPDIVTPDLAGWHRARFPVAAFDDDAPAALTVAPDWLCEVLSPCTEAYDRGPKLRVYRCEGVGHVWLVDPALRTLEVFRLEGARFTLVDTWEGDGPVRAEPFDAVALPLEALWRL